MYSYFQFSFLSKKYLQPSIPSNYGNVLVRLIEINKNVKDNQQYKQNNNNTHTHINTLTIVSIIWEVVYVSHMRTSCFYLFILERRQNFINNMFVVVKRVFVIICKSVRKTILVAKILHWMYRLFVVCLFSNMDR